VDLEFGFQLGDTPPGRNQLGEISRSHAGDLAAVDEFLAAPVVDRLVADLKIVDQLRDGTACPQQIKHLATELGRVSPRHVSPQRGRGMEVNQPESVEPGEHHFLSWE
jgi:hypothetical protein